MAGPGGREVGRVSVKVAPDTSGALDDIRRFVNEAERLTINLKVEADTSGVRAQIEAATAGLDGETVNVNVDANTAAARAETAAFEVDTEGLSATVNVAADTAAARAETAAFEAAVDGDDVDINVGADTSAGRAAVFDLDALIGGLDPAMRVNANTTPARSAALDTDAYISGLTPEVDVNADTTRALAEADLAVARINAKTATIKVNIDSPGLGGVGGRGDGLGGVFDGLTKSLSGFLGFASGAPGIIGSIVGGLGSLADVSTSAATGMFSLATETLGMSKGMGAALGAIGAVVGAVGAAVGAVVQLGAQIVFISVIAGAITAAVGAIGSAVSALPALLFGAAGAVGVLAIAFSNFGDALGRGKTGAALEKQNKALAALPPPARAAADAINTNLLPAFDTLRSAVQTAFFTGFAAEITDLAARVMPALTLSLQGLAASVGTFLVSLTAVATTDAGIANLNASFAGMSELLTIITPSMQGLVTVLLQAAGTRQVWQLLGEIISSVVSRVTELFAKFSEGGATSLMVQSLTQLRNVLDAAAGALVTLVLKATEFFTAAGPGLTSLFESLERTLSRIDFAGLGAAFGTFSATVGAFFDRVPQSVWDGLVASVQGVAAAFARWAADPAMQGLFNAIIIGIGAAITGFGIFLDVIRNVVDFARGFAATMLGVFADIAGGINTFVQAMPFIPQSVKDATQAAADGLRGFSDTVNTEMARAAGAPAANAPTAQAGGQTFGAGIVAGATAGMAPLPPEVLAAAARGVDQVRGQAGNAQAGGQTFGQSAVAGATAGMAPLPQNVLDAAARGVDSVRGQEGNMQGAGNQVGTAGAGGARDGIAPMPGDMGGAARDAAGRIGGERPGFHGAGADVAEGARQGVAEGRSGLIEAAIGIARAAWEAAKSFLGIASPSRLFRDTVGLQIPAGMAVGIDKGAPLVASSIQTLTATALTANAATDTAAFSYGQSIGVQVTAGMRSTFQAQSPGLIAAAQELLARVQAGGQVFEDLSFRGMSANLGEFNDQLADMFYASGKSLQTFLSGLASSPAISPAAVQAGKSIGQQIVIGIDKALTDYTIKAPTRTLPGAKASQAYDYITDRTRASYQTGIWDGTAHSIPNGHGPLPQQSTADALQNMTWSVELDPEGLAKITAKGQRTLDRR